MKDHEIKKTPIIYYYDNTIGSHVIVILEDTK